MSINNNQNVYNKYQLLENERNKTQEIIRQDKIVNSIYKDTTINLSSNYYNYMLYFLIVIFLLILLFKFNFITTNQQNGGSTNKKHSFILLYLFLILLIIYNASIKNQ